MYTKKVLVPVDQLFEEYIPAPPGIEEPSDHQYATVDFTKVPIDKEKPEVDMYKPLVSKYHD